MQIVSSGNRFHECQILFSGKRKKDLSPAKLAQRVVKIKEITALKLLYEKMYIWTCDPQPTDTCTVQSAFWAHCE